MIITDELREKLKGINQELARQKLDAAHQILEVLREHSERCLKLLDQYRDAVREEHPGREILICSEGEHFHPFPLDYKPPFTLDDSDIHITREVTGLAAGAHVLEAVVDANSTAANLIKQIGSAKFSRHGKVEMPSYPTRMTIGADSALSIIRNRVDVTGDGVSQADKHAASEFFEGL